MSEREKKIFLLGGLSAVAIMFALVMMFIVIALIESI